MWGKKNLAVGRAFRSLAWYVVTGGGRCSAYGLRLLDFFSTRRWRALEKKIEWSGERRFHPPYNSFSLAFRKNSAKSMVKGSAKNVHFWHKVWCQNVTPHSLRDQHFAKIGVPLSSWWVVCVYVRWEENKGLWTLSLSGARE